MSTRFFHKKNTLLSTMYSLAEGLFKNIMTVTFSNSCLFKTPHFEYITLNSLIGKNCKQFIQSNDTCQTSIINKNVRFKATINPKSYNSAIALVHKEKGSNQEINLTQSAHKQICIRCYY